MNTRQITRNELEAKLNARTPVVLLEALPAGYFQDKHLPTARNMPHHQVRQLAATMLPVKPAEIVVYCASDTCQNSHIAGNVLFALGYPNVSVYPGGKKEWEEAGLPFEA
jgi:rhodanese-related sulfurtransferase